VDGKRIREKDGEILN